MQDHLVERDTFFDFKVAVIVDANVALVGSIWGDTDAKFVFNITIGHALQPSSSGDGGEAVS